MRDKITRRQFVFFLFLRLLVFANFASAESDTSPLEKTSLFIRAGYSHFFETYLGGRTAFSAGGVLPISNNVGFEFEGRGDLLMSAYDSQRPLQSLGEGDLNLVGVNVSVFYMSFSSERIGLYVLAGGGYSFNKFSQAEDYGPLGFNIEESVNNSLSLHVGAGFDVAVFKKMALNLDIRYSVSNAEGKWSIEDTLGTASISDATETNLNRLSFMLGFKFFL